MFLEILTSFNDVQPEKVSSPISVTVSGNTILCNLIQFANANAPIFFTPSSPFVCISISSIDVYCCYDYNINTAYFDNISLVKDTNCVTRYSYNDYGYVSNVTGSDGQGVSYGYESNGVDVGRVSSTNGKKLDFEYDDNHRLIHETNTNGSNNFSIDYTYDTYGNIQTTKISSLNQYNYFTINSH